MKSFLQKMRLYSEALADLDDPAEWAILAASGRSALERVGRKAASPGDGRITDT
jgi:hypothetical protein